MERAQIMQNIEAWSELLLAIWRRRRLGRARVLSTSPQRLQREELASLGRSVQRLSRGLTGNRRLPGSGYLADEDMLGAYLLYYWPISFLQTQWILNDQAALSRPWARAQGQSSSMLDLGSGPGPIACAAAMAGYQQFTLVDAIQEALDLAKQVVVDAASTFPGFPAAAHWNFVRSPIEASQSEIARSSGAGHFGLVTWGHVVNEIASSSNTKASREGVIASFDNLMSADGTHLILEPALPETSRPLLGLRDKLVKPKEAAKSRRLDGPCFFQGFCPAYAKEGETCHSSPPIGLPSLVRSIADAAGLDRSVVSMAWLACGVQGSGNSSKSPAVLYRVTSEHLVNKAGRTRLMICGEPEGRKSLSVRFGESKPETEERFQELRRGEALSIEAAEARESGWGLRPDTVLERLSTKVLSRSGT